MSMSDLSKYEQPHKGKDSLQPKISSKDSLQRLLDAAALLFYLIPQNLISWATGALARVRWPRPIRGYVLQGFIDLFKINMAEAQDSGFQSIEDIFTRALKPGSREIQGGFVSPADGFLVRSEPLTEGQGVQAKGLFFGVDELLGKSGEIGKGSWYFTVYLAPHNYHRVHAPWSGVLREVGHIPGDLWPVNAPFVARIPRLFNRNERVVFKIEAKEGGFIWVVMVGAFNVGRMTSTWAPFLTTNSDFGCGSPRARWASVEKVINVGDELGTFMLGSTVILVLDQDAVRARGGDGSLLAVTEKTMVQMGQSLVRGIND
jgi:phosphatidylserine decarboxylase